MGCSLLRIKVPELLEDEWFKKGYKQATFIMEEHINVDDVLLLSMILRCCGSKKDTNKQLCKDLLIILWKYNKDSIEVVFYV